MHLIEEKTSTLKEVSFDEEHDEYMVESDLQVCWFDKVKEWYVKNKIPLANPNPKSNDALFFGEKESYFIEFKNGRINNTVNYEIIKKIYDSLFILFDLNYEDKEANKVDSISYTRANMNYILVYNEERYAEAGPTRQTQEGIERQKSRVNISPHRDKLYSTIRKLGNQTFIKFGLDQFENYFFKNVYTYTVDEFQKEFVGKQNVGL